MPSEGSNKAAGFEYKEQVHAVIIGDFGREATSKFLDILFTKERDLLKGLLPEGHCYYDEYSALTYSVVGATIGEWVGGQAGLGLFMLRSKNAMATDQVFVAMLITSLLSIGLFVIVYLVERAVLPWYYSAQRVEQWEGTGIY